MNYCNTPKPLSEQLDCNKSVEEKRPYLLVKRLDNLDITFELPELNADDELPEGVNLKATIKSIRKRPRRPAFPGIYSDESEPILTPGTSIRPSAQTLQSAIPPVGQQLPVNPRIKDLLEGGYSWIPTNPFVDLKTTPPIVKQVPRPRRTCLDFYIKTMENRLEMESDGLCGTFGHLSEYGLVKPSRLDTLYPAEASGFFYDDGSAAPPHIYDKDCYFNPLRQNIVLLLAAMRDELDDDCKKYINKKVKEIRTLKEDYKFDR